MLNISLGRVGGLGVVLQALKQGNLDVDVLQETNLMDEIHAQ